MSNQSRPKRSSFCLHLNFDLIYQASCYNTKKQIIVLFNEKPIKFWRRRRTINFEHKQKLSSTFNHNQDMNLKKLNFWPSRNSWWSPSHNVGGKASHPLEVSLVWNFRASLCEVCMLLLDTFAVTCCGWKNWKNSIFKSRNKMSLILDQ